MLDEMTIGKMLQNLPFTFVLFYSKSKGARNVNSTFEKTSYFRSMSAVHSNTINKYIHVSKNITSFCADVDYLINE